MKQTKRIVSIQKTGPEFSNRFTPDETAKSEFWFKQQVVVLLKDIKQETDSPAN